MCYFYSRIFPFDFLRKISVCRIVVLCPIYVTSRRSAFIQRNMAVTMTVGLFNRHLETESVDVKQTEMYMIMRRAGRSNGV